MTRRISLFAAVLCASTALAMMPVRAQIPGPDSPANQMKSFEQVQETLRQGRLLTPEQQVQATRDLACAEGVPLSPDHTYHIYLPDPYGNNARAWVHSADGTSYVHPGQVWTPGSVMPPGYSQPPGWNLRTQAEQQQLHDQAMNAPPQIGRGVSPPTDNSAVNQRGRAEQLASGQRAHEAQVALAAQGPPQRRQPGAAPGTFAGVTVTRPDSVPMPVPLPECKPPPVVSVDEHPDLSEAWFRQHRGVAADAKEYWRRVELAGPLTDATEAADKTALQTKVLPLCQDESILTGVRNAIERGAPLNNPVLVFKIYNEAVFATTPMGSLFSGRGLLSGIGAKMPTCIASVMTNHGESTIAYSWKVVDGQTFVTVQPWDDQPTDPGDSPN